MTTYKLVKANDTGTESSKALKPGDWVPGLGTFLKYGPARRTALFGPDADDPSPESAGWIGEDAIFPTDVIIRSLEEAPLVFVGVLRPVEVLPVIRYKLEGKRGEMVTIEGLVDDPHLRIRVGNYGPPGWADPDDLIEAVQKTRKAYQP